MSSIKAHVEGHLLSMEQYANLYERRKILELESERRDKLESVYSVTRCKKKADLSGKNKTIESQSFEHTRANFRQYLNDISKKK